VSLARVFLENLLPVMLLAGVGWLVRRRIGIDPKPLAQIVFYVLSPALIFNLLVEIPVALGDMLRMAGFVTLLLAILATVAWLTARALRLSRTLTSALILTVTFMNAGNLGLPITQLALGQVPLAWATVFFSTTALLSNSVGAWVAGVGRATPARALAGLARVPAVFAIPLALALRAAGFSLPPLAAVPIGLLAGAAIPSMLLLLGMQLAGVGRPASVGLLAASGALRLVASPLIAWLVSPIFALPPAAFQAGLLESAMPSAVLNSILATQYDVEPEFVSGAVLFSTMLSMFTLSPLLLMFQ